VSKAMKNELLGKWSFKSVTVIYDKPNF